MFKFACRFRIVIIVVITIIVIVRSLGDAEIRFGTTTRSHWGTVDGSYARRARQKADTMFCPGTGTVPGRLISR